MAGRSELTLVLASNAIAIGAALVALDARARAEDCRDAVEAGSEPTPEFEPSSAVDGEPAAEAGSELLLEPVAPEPDTEFSVLWNSLEDPPPAQLAGMSDKAVGQHYFVSDEWNPQLFRRAIQGVGGGYVGVGSEQAYLYLSWARPEFAWLLDYDRLIVDVHRVQAQFFKAAADPAAYVELWTPEAEATALALIGDDAGLKNAYLRARPRMTRRLPKLMARMQETETPCFLTDQADYTAVRDLIVSGRVRPMAVDLNGDVGLSGIGAAAQKLGVPIRVLYLSNAEQYWTYGSGFRAGVRGLPMDEESVVLRTLSSRRQNGDFRYNVQSGHGFQARLADPTLLQVYSMVPLRTIRGSEDIDYIETL